LSREGRDFGAEIGAAIRQSFALDDTCHSSPPLKP
jgi:hypothetical protein